MFQIVSTETAEVIIGVVTLFFAYVISVSISGFLRALISQSMGDNTPEELGFLTLNPLQHIDMMGIVFLYLIGFGWGQYIPVLPEHISNRLKAFIVQFSDTIAHAFLYFTGSFTLLWIFGQSMPMIILVTLYSRIPLYKFIAHQLADTSSFNVILVLILVGITSLNLILATVSCLRNMIIPIMHFFFHNSPFYWQHNFLMHFFGLLLALIFFGNWILYFLLNLSFIVGSYIIALF